MHRRTGRSPVVGLYVAAVLGLTTLTACGGDGQTGDDGSTPSTPSAASSSTATGVRALPNATRSVTYQSLDQLARASAAVVTGTVLTSSEQLLDQPPYTGAPFEQAQFRVDRVVRGRLTGTILVNQYGAEVMPVAFGRGTLRKGQTYLLALAKDPLSSGGFVVVSDGQWMLTAGVYRNDTAMKDDFDETIDPARLHAAFTGDN